MFLYHAAMFCSKSFRECSTHWVLEILQNIANTDFCDFSLIGQMNVLLFFHRCGMILDIFQNLIMLWALNVLTS